MKALTLTQPSWSRHRDKFGLREMPLHRIVSIKMLPEPIPAKGALSLWDWERP